MHKHTHRNDNDCMWLVHTFACALDIIVQNSVIVSARGHAQQAGLTCCRVTNDQETLVGDTETHYDSFL